MSGPAAGKRAEYARIDVVAGETVGDPAELPRLAEHGPLALSNPSKSTVKPLMAALR